MVNTCTVEHNPMEFNQFIEKPNAMKCLNILGAVDGLFLVSFLLLYIVTLRKIMVNKVFIFWRS